MDLIELASEELLAEVTGGGRGKGFSVSIDDRVAAGTKFEPAPETFPIEPNAR